MATKKKAAKKAVKKSTSRKRSPAKKAAKKRTPAKKSARKSPAKKSAPKKAAKKKNKLGVKNSLVNNINARKKKGISRPKKKGSVKRKDYNKMEDNWGK